MKAGAKWVRLALISAALTVVGACEKTEPSRFYLLSPIANSGASASSATADPDLALAIGPIHLPKHLDRAQIVTLSSPNRIELAEFDRWAEPLSENFTRVLAENLSVLLGTQRILVHPSSRNFPVDYRVVIDVSRFEVARSGRVKLSARWRILDPKQRSLVLMRKSSSNRPILGSGFEPTAAAMSDAVAELSRNIVDALRSIRPR